MSVASSPLATGELTYREAIRSVLFEEMRSDPRVVLMGEDVGQAGGPFKTSVGLADAFPDRVIDTPIAENSFVGAALGMAATGLRPVVEIMFADFLLVAADAIVNELAKLRFMSGNQIIAPVTIRAIGGGTMHFGAQHSATYESLFVQVPGLHIATAGSPASAYGLLRFAMQLDEPVLFIEHKGLYARRGAVDADPRPYAPGRSRLLRKGRDVTVVASLLMVERSLEAAMTLAGEGIDVEVIDVQWVQPLDVHAVAESVGRTGRLIVVSEQVHEGSWAATLISRLAQDGAPWRVSPIVLGLPRLAMPFSPPLEAAMIPSAVRIQDAIRLLTRRS